MLRGGGLGGEQGHRAGAAPRGVEGEGLHRYRGYEVIVTLVNTSHSDLEKKERLLSRARALMTEAGFKIGMSDGGLVTEAKPNIKWDKVRSH